MIWVILPAYDEAANLPRLLSDLGTVLSAGQLPARVVVVDDGSTDGTGTVAASWQGSLPLQVVSHERNLGLAAAIRTGLAYVLHRCAPEDAIVTMDADNSHSPDLIPLMTRVLADGVDVVIASRFAKGGREQGVPAFRRLLSRGVSILVRARAGLWDVQDVSSGFRVYRGGVLQEAVRIYGDRLIETRGFAVMTELLLKLLPLRPVIREVPLRLRYDLKRSRSKLALGGTAWEYLSLLHRPRPSRTRTGAAL